MPSKIEMWNSENEWLNAFAETFIQDTRHMVYDVVIEADDGCVGICGRTRSYYAVQLAIHCTQTFKRDRPVFAMTRLSLEVNDHTLELSISHQLDREPVDEALPKTPDTRRDLVLA